MHEIKTSKSFLNNQEVLPRIKAVRTFSPTVALRALKGFGLVLAAHPLLASATAVLSIPQSLIFLADALVTLGAHQLISTPEQHEAEIESMVSRLLAMGMNTRLAKLYFEAMCLEVENKTK